MLREALPNARQCGRCAYGPIDHFACADLRTHHDERLAGGAKVSNACPECGWFAPHIDAWPRWDGVTRKPSLQGPGNSVSADFDWAMQVSAASIQVPIYDMELKPLFSSRGGMDATEAIDTRSSAGRYVRRRNILENDNYVMEGIQLAFHPFIVYQDWPGNPD